MYARLTRIQAPVDRIDDLTTAFKGKAIPSLKVLPGYAGSSLAVDRGSGDAQAVTWWESREAMEASENAATTIRTDTVSAGGGDVRSVQRLEVALLERVGQPGAPVFLRVVRGKADPARIDAMVQAARDKALPVVRQLNGFRALNVAVDRAGGDFIVTGVWATAADREASDAQIADIRREIFDLGGVGQPEIARYEVLHVEFTRIAATTA